MKADLVPAMMKEFVAIYEKNGLDKDKTALQIISELADYLALPYQMDFVASTAVDRETKLKDGAKKTTPVIGA